MINPEEKKDLDELKSKINEVKIRTIDYQIALSQMNEGNLIMSGYRYGHAAAYEVQVKKANSEIEKLTRAFLKKYPD